MPARTRSRAGETAHRVTKAPRKSTAMSSRRRPRGNAKPDDVDHEERPLETANPDEEVNDDDCCPICQLLICNPVTTSCNHTMCRSCMATWADVSLAAPMTIVSVNEELHDFDAVTDVEASCPMCRTQTKAVANLDRAHALAQTYPSTYPKRLAEEAQDNVDGESIQTMTVYIGNRHSFIQGSDPEDGNVHQWAFFVKPSRPSIIEEVQIYLHPTFRQNQIIRARPPYEVQRIGWGIFTVSAAVILKAGYSWVSSDAEDSPDGATKGMLRLDWTLDFDGFDATGSMGRCRLKVKNDRAWDGLSDEEEVDNAQWNRTVRAYQQDENYVPE